MVANGFHGPTGVTAGIQEPLSWRRQHRHAGLD